MTQLRWVIDGTLALRCGPDHTPWTPSALRDAGVRAVLSLNRAAQVDAGALADADIRHA